MTTKKQKRAAAEAKHEVFMAKYRADGLTALKADRARRRTQSEKDLIEARRINLQHRQILAKHGINPDTGIHVDVEREYNFGRPVPIAAQELEMRRIIEDDLEAWIDVDLV